MTSIYTCTDEYIQPYETSIIPGATNIGLCDEFVGHFEFFYDPDIYLSMHAALMEPVPARPGDLMETNPPQTMPGMPTAPPHSEAAGLVAPAGTATTCAASPQDSTPLGTALLFGAVVVLVLRRPELDSQCLVSIRAHHHEIGRTGTLQTIARGEMPSLHVCPARTP